MKKEKQEIVKAWVAAGLWLVLIAIESTDLLSANNTGRVLYAVVKFLFGPISLVKFHYWHAIARKVGHVVGYGILSVLLFRAWQVSLPLPGGPRWSWRWAQVAVYATVFVAALDEWHQSFIPSRTGTWRDVVLDGVAGIAAQILVYLCVKGWRSQRTQQLSAAG